MGHLRRVQILATGATARHWRSGQTVRSKTLVGAVRRVAAVASAGVFLASCGSATASDRHAVASVTLSAPPTTLAAEDKAQLTATALDASGAVVDGVSFVWQTSSVALALVTNTGMVTGVGPGVVAISASAQGKTGTIQLTVVPPRIDAMTVSLSAPTTLTGTRVQATVVLRDVLGNKLTGHAVAWSSDNTAVATVDSDGIVSASGAGLAAITATSEGKSAVATLTVIQR